MKTYSSPPFEAGTNLDSILASRDIILPTKVRLVKATGFSSSHVQMWEVYHKEGWVLRNWCFWILELEKTLESPLDSKGIKPVNPKSVLNILWKDWCWSYDPLATWYEKATHWKRPWCWERLTVGGEGDDRGWDGWMASPTQGTWVWVSSGRWWRTGKAGRLQSVGSQSQTWLRNWTTKTSFGNLLSVYTFWRDVSDFLHCLLSEVQLVGIFAAVWTFAGAPGAVLPNASLGGSSLWKFRQKVVLTAVLFLCSP